MGIYDNVEGVARKSMVMFFLIDTSGSMEGRSIAAVNDAMELELITLYVLQILSLQ